MNDGFFFFDTNEVFLNVFNFFLLKVSKVQKFSEKYIVRNNSNWHWGMRLWFWYWRDMYFSLNIFFCPIWICVQFSNYHGLGYSVIRYLWSTNFVQTLSCCLSNAYNNPLSNFEIPFVRWVKWFRKCPVVNQVGGVVQSWERYGPYLQSACIPKCGQYHQVFRIPGLRPWHLSEVGREQWELFSLSNQM